MLVLLLILGALLVAVWMSVDPSWTRRAWARAGSNLGASVTTSASTAPLRRLLLFDQRQPGVAAHGVGLGQSP